MGKGHVWDSLLVFVLILVLTSTFSLDGVHAWSNGGYSDDPTHPDYGTHDWIAQHALDWLPTEEKQYISSNLAGYLFGTELPDNPNKTVGGIGDSIKHHHIYFNSSGVMTDDAAAVRAQAEYNNTMAFLKVKDFVNAAKNAGIMSHYIVDMAVFGHVMGKGTDWGTEEHHTDDYEPYVNAQTSSYTGGEFTPYLSFDHSLDAISAYDAAKNLAYDTTFDVDGDLNCTWMDKNYNESSPVFKSRVVESLNLAVNYLTDVLHTLYLDASPSDLTLPITTINLNGVLGDNGWFTSNVEVTLSASDNTGVEKTEYKMNNANWISYTASFAVTHEGDTVVYYNSTDKAGNIETTKTKIVRIDKTQPTADAGLDQTVNVGATITFDASGSADNLGIASYLWNFGDGSTGTGMTTFHVYNQARTYNVTLTVKDSAGNTSTDTLTVKVSTPAEAFPMWIVGIAILAMTVLSIGVIAIRKRKT